MLYVIGNNIEYSGYLRDILKGLGDADALLKDKGERRGSGSSVGNCEVDTSIPFEITIRTKYYDARVPVLNATVDEYLSFGIDTKKEPRAILLFLDDKHKIEDNDELFGRLRNDFSRTDQTSCGGVLRDYHSEYKFNDDITRVCFLVKNNSNSNDADLNKLVNICNENSFELVAVSTLKDDPPDEMGDGEDCPTEYSPLSGVLRAVQALHCTIWDDIESKPTQNSEFNLDEGNVDIENSFNQFDLINSMMTSLPSEIKHLNDQERREKASKIMFDIIKHLNIDLDE
ncbi:hypothetical protein FG386_002847 [Cryptosporidium ryanae]|uniref:uncharacterized protein n=1 Tax=Cryptosporidium ryanae TaxID=515981 RepID=UPI00351AA57B|nr:hypothetical protein FG386_002847 [Cryptosporidium ryanae]